MKGSNPVNENKENKWDFGLQIKIMTIKFSKETKEIIKLFVATYLAILILSLGLAFFDLDYSLVRWSIMLIVPIMIGFIKAYNFLLGVKLGRWKPLNNNGSVKLPIILYVKLSIALILGYALYLVGEYLTSGVLVPLLDSTFTEAVQRSRIGLISTLIFDYAIFKSFVLAYFSYLISYYLIIFVGKKKNREATLL